LSLCLLQLPHEMARGSFTLRKHTLENSIRNETRVMRDGRQGSVEYFVASVRKETAVRAAGKDHRDRSERVDRGQPNDRRQCGTTENVS